MLLRRCRKRLEKMTSFPVVRPCLLAGGSREILVFLVSFSPQKLGTSYGEVFMKESEPLFPRPPSGRQFLPLLPVFY